jgi:hypothetical protein
MHVRLRAESQPPSRLRYAFQVQPHLCGHLLQRAQALREQDHVGRIDGRYGDRRSYISVVVDEGDDFLALLVCVPRVANAIAPFLATVLMYNVFDQFHTILYSVFVIHS